jgi:hypothetical protein
VDPVISGGIVAVFSIGLTQGANMLVDRRKSAQRERSVLLAVSDEVKANRELAVNNQNLLDTELEFLKEDKRLVNPIDPLGEGFWCGGILL